MCVTCVCVICACVWCITRLTPRSSPTIIHVYAPTRNSVRDMCVYGMCACVCATRVCVICVCVTCVCVICVCGVSTCVRDMCVRDMCVCVVHYPANTQIESDHHPRVRADTELCA